MRIILRNRILINFVLVIIFFAIISALMGTFFINRTTLVEEQRRVSVDLRSAWSVLQGKCDELTIMVGVLGTGQRVANAYHEPDRQAYRVSLERVRCQFKLDFLTLTDAEGRVILRTLSPYRTGDDLSNDPFVRSALAGQTSSGFYRLGPERLTNEGGDLLERAFMVFEPTSKAKQRAKTSEDSGLAMIAAAPVVDEAGRVYGAIYAGNLLNRNNALVDQIRSMVFENQLYNGRPVGTVTIFQWDVRVATNVILPNGNRALGTRVSAEVYDKVLENNSSWYDRAFVVNDWYISAYDPIRDFDGRVVGILYVGVLAKKYDDIRTGLWKIYSVVSLIGALLVILVGLIFASRLTRTVARLAEGAMKIAGGNLDYSVKLPRADDELRDLTGAFNSMAASLQDREIRLKAATDELEQTNASLQRLNQAYLEMVEFVSHELKNTLGVIYTSSKTLAGGLAGPLGEKQSVLVDGIVRNIDAAVSMARRYLDLARIEKGELRASFREIELREHVIEPVIRDIRGNLENHGMVLSLDLPQTVNLTGDPDLLRVVFKNLLDNALKYGRPGGQIRISGQRRDKQYHFEVWNEGPGLNPEQIGRLFGRFVRFAADRPGETRGTGLGLFITKDIILRHGGSIKAESEEGHWIMFCIDLPVDLNQPLEKPL